MSAGEGEREQAMDRMREIWRTVREENPEEYFLESLAAAALAAQGVHVTDVPLAAALMTKLKEECERQHALAEEAERERDEAREALHEKSEALETMLRLEFDHAPLCPIRTRRCDCKGTG